MRESIFIFQVQKKEQDIINKTHTNGIQSLSDREFCSYMKLLSDYNADTGHAIPNELIHEMSKRDIVPRNFMH